MTSTAPVPDVWTIIGHVGQIAPIVEAIAVTATAVLAFATINAWRKENIGKRKVDLAEQALLTFYELREKLILARRQRQEPEGYPPLAAFEERRSEYYNRFMLLEGSLNLTSSLEGQRPLFRVYFGAHSARPFDKILKCAQDLQEAARWIFTGVPNVVGAEAPAREKLLSTLGWSNDARPDAIDRAIDEAVSDLERLTKPVLEGRQ